MNFSYNENQIEIKALAEKIFSELANDERQKLIDASGSRFDPELWQQLAESGLLGIAIDQPYGGMGFDFESLSLVIEEAGRYVAAVPLITTLVSAALPIQRFAPDKIKQPWLAAIASGKTIVSAALSTDHDISAELKNSELGNTQLNSTQLDKNSHWIINGRTSCVPYAAYAQAVLIAADSTQGKIIALIDPTADEVSLYAQQSTANEPWSEIHFDQLQINPDSIIATGEQAEQCLAWAKQLTQTANCAKATGISDKMLRLTAAYTSQREQFGRPIATFQAVGQRAADCFIDIECLRLCTQEAISLLSQQDPGDDQQDLINEAVSVAKIWCGDVCHRVSQASQHLHGGIGVDRDYPLHRYCLWCKQLELSLGSSAQVMEQLGDQIAVTFKADSFTS